MKKKLTNTYLSMFCAEMAITFQAGISLSDSVRMLLTDADKDSKIILESLLEELNLDAPLSVALEKSGYFPAHMTAVVKAGEKTGRMTDMLKSLSDYYDRLDRLSLTIKNAVFFPLILLTIMVLVVIILITKVLPIFGDVFARLGSRMSPLALALTSFGEALSGAAVIIACVFGALVIIAVFFGIFGGLRGRVFNMFRKKLGGRGIFGEVSCYHFVSVMSLALESGLDVEKAAELASEVSGGSSLSDKKNAECRRILSEGGTIGAAMGDAGILTEREASFLAFGSKGGVVDSAFSEITRRKERNLFDGIDRMVSRIEPLLIIVISAIVGVILLSVMLPLLGIMNSIG